MTPGGREVLVRRIAEESLRPTEAAQACGVSPRTAYKWLKRYREEGVSGLLDRSSRPHRCPHPLEASRQERIIALRRCRQSYRRISQRLGVAQSTVGRVLARAGLNRLSALEPTPPALRYNYAHAGELLHLDIKKLGRFRRPGHRVTGDRQLDSRGAGREYVHVAIDDASRVGYTAIHPDESARSACRFLLAALRYYRGLGVCIRRVMTDNGACYKSRRFRRLCRRLQPKHLRTQPYTPRTNGKAERAEPARPRGSACGPIAAARRHLFRLSTFAVRALKIQPALRHPPAHDFASGAATKNVPQPGGYRRGAGHGQCKS